MQLEEKKDFFINYRNFLKCKTDMEREKYLKNDSFVKSAIEKLDTSDLADFFFRYYPLFNKDLLNKIEIMKPLTLRVYNAIQVSNLKTNLEAMREIASQPGIHPAIICYVHPIIRNDLQFICNIITNTDSIYDFFHPIIALPNENESEMRYYNLIGKDIQTNPMFWEMLNALLKKEGSNRLFDSKKEIEIAKKYFFQMKDASVEITSFDNVDRAISITLQKGEYFEEDNSYFIKFDYPSFEQGKYMLDAFEKIIPECGAGSLRFKEGQDYIRPYLVDEFGLYTGEKSKAKGIGGTNIPEDLLYEFLRRMVEVDNCIIKCGEEVMKDTFSPKTLENMMHFMNDNKMK